MLLAKSQVLREGLAYRKMPRRHLVGRLINGCHFWASHMVSTVPLSCQPVQFGVQIWPCSDVSSVPSDIEEGRRHQNLNGKMADLGLGQCWDRLWGDGGHLGDSVMCSLTCTHDYPYLTGTGAQIFTHFPHLNTPLLCASGLKPPETNLVLERP